MLGSLNSAASGMSAQAKQLDVISNNLANANTTAYKKSRADFQDLLYQNVLDPGAATSATTENPTGVQMGTGVQLIGTTRMHEPGSPRNTQRELDMMINGDGFFTLQLPDGNLAFSRDGNFQLGNDGRLLNASGYPLVPEVMVPPGTQSLQIAADGVVRAHLGGTDVQELGQIQLSTFANPAGLQALGGNVYGLSVASGAPVQGAPGEPGLGAILQRHLESSNVVPVTEMTDMIRAQRVYELNSKIMSTTDQMLSTLGQIR